MVSTGSEASLLFGSLMSKVWGLQKFPHERQGVAYQKTMSKEFQKVPMCSMLAHTKI